MQALVVLIGDGSRRLSRLITMTSLTTATPASSRCSPCSTKVIIAWRHPLTPLQTPENRDIISVQSADVCHEKTDACYSTFTAALHRPGAGHRAVMASGGRSQSHASTNNGLCLSSTRPRTRLHYLSSRHRRHAGGNTYSLPVGVGWGRKAAVDTPVRVSATNSPASHPVSCASCPIIRSATLPACGVAQRNSRVFLKPNMCSSV